MELNDFTVFIGANNSGKTTIINAIRIVFENISKFKERTVIEQYVPQHIRTDTLWFFENSREPAVIRAIVTPETHEVEILRDYFQEVKDIKLEVRLEKVAEDRVRLKLNELSLLGYVTVSSKKADEILKALGVSSKERYTELKIVEDTRVVDRSVFDKILLMLEDKVHYVNVYENVEVPGYEIKALIPHSLLPRSYINSFERAMKDPEKRMKLASYSEEITGSVYHPSLEKQYRRTFFRYEEFGGGDQVVDSLIAVLLDKGSGHIFLLEEPEIHLHPSYAKRLGGLLEKLVKNEKIQMVIVSHSPMFIRYLSDIENSLCIVKKVPNNGFFTTKIIQLSEMGKVFPERVIKRDLFFSDLLMLVEGRSDEIIIDKCIEVLRLDPLSHLYIGYVHYAERKIEEILELVVEIAEIMDVPKFMIADGDKAGKEYICEALNKGFKEGEEVFGLKSEDIFFVVREDILNEAISEVIEKLKGEMGEEVVELGKICKLKIKNKKDLESLFSKVENKIPWWKIELASAIVKRINEERDLKPEIRNLLNNINGYVREVVGI